jgi:predicted DCC family thiol-disulfide oxidoreductase YuxK
MNPHKLTGRAAAEYIAEHRYTWPGGYELFAVCYDGGILCATCCAENIDLIEADEDNLWSGWRVVGIDSAECCEELTVCDHCGRVIFDAED